jgi:hypothetical protein
MPKSFDGRTFFYPGWAGVGLEILSIRQTSPRLVDRIYRIRYDCCDTEAEIKYEALYGRYKSENRERTTLKCRDCAQRAFVEKGHNIAHAASKAMPAHEKYQHLRAPALRMMQKGTLPASEVDDWLEIPRGTTAHWMRNSGQTPLKKTEIYRIQNPALALAFSGAWR